MEHEETNGNGTRLSTKAKILDEIVALPKDCRVADTISLPELIAAFFGYRQNILYVTSVSAQIALLPIGRLMESVLPNKCIRIPGTKWSFSMNPGPFNLKEHVLITIFANSGSSPPAAVAIITIVKAFYHGRIDAVPAMLLTQTTQVNLS
ncbi:hypothetical protein Peur_006918 [Populus x canadensis]